MRSPDCKRSLAVTVALTATMTACREPELPPIVWEGEHLRFGTFADESELCAGTLPYLDGLVGHLAEAFGRDGVYVDYYWLPDDPSPDEYCTSPIPPEGCANEHGVFTQYSIHQHELVHAVRSPHLLYTPFEEGLAEAYGDDWGRFPVEGNIRHLLEDPRGYGYIPGPGYGLAAHFVSYLEATRGLDQLMALDAATSQEDSFASAEVAFGRTYGEPLDDVIAAYQAEYPRCDPRVFRDNSFDCNRNVVSAPTGIDDRIEMTVSMACDDPNVLGPRLGHRWTAVAFDVQVEGKYHLSVHPTESIALESIRITRCDISCFEYSDDLPSQLTGDSIGGRQCFRPGRYLFRLAIDEELDEDYDFNVALATIESCD